MACSQEMPRRGFQGVAPPLGRADTPSATRADPGTHPGSFPSQWASLARYPRRPGYPEGQPVPPPVGEPTFEHTEHAKGADPRALNGRRIDGRTVVWDLPGLGGPDRTKDGRPPPMGP